MSLVKSADEIANMRAGGRILAKVLHEVAASAQPGVTTRALNDLAERRLRELGAEPSFLQYGAETGNPFPASLCTSVNQGVVHGIPSAGIALKEGDIVGLDLGCWYQGLCTDMAVTCAIGQVTPEAHKLIKITELALHEGLKRVKAFGRVGDIGSAIQTLVEAHGFSVVRQLTGHGVGKAVHEEPAVPNFGRSGVGLKLVPGMTLAIEPMVNAGGYEVKTLADGWSVVTADSSLSAHFEHTVLVTQTGCEILTRV